MFVHNLIMKRPQKQLAPLFSALTSTPRMTVSRSPSVAYLADSQHSGSANGNEPVAALLAQKKKTRLAGGDTPAVDQYDCKINERMIRTRGRTNGTSSSASLHRQPTRQLPSDGALHRQTSSDLARPCFQSLQLAAGRVSRPVFPSTPPRELVFTCLRSEDRSFDSGTGTQPDRHTMRVPQQRSLPAVFTILGRQIPKRVIFERCESRD